MRSKILYIGWTGRGNLGDEILFDTFKKETKTSPLISYEIVEYQGVNSLLDESSYAAVVLGGGSILTLPDMVAPAVELAKRGIPLVTWGSGIDALFPDDLDGFLKRFQVPGALEAHSNQLLLYLNYFMSVEIIRKESLNL